jgi:hypothetical protein
MAIKWYVVSASVLLCCGAARSQQIKVLLDNDKVRVTEYTAKPHEGVCGAGMHSHPEHLTVILQGAKVKVTTPDGKSVERQPGNNYVFWSDSSTHSVENVDTTIRKSLIIELKESGTESKKK